MISFEEELAKQNSHWVEKEAFKDVSLDKKRQIFSVLKSKLKEKPITALNGPRRLGKSYLLKQLIKESVKGNKIPPQNYLYFLFQSTQNEKNIIRELLDIYLAKYADRNHKIYIFLDEVQYIDYWQDQIKYYYDTEKNIKFVISGSTSLFYKQKSRESLSGRIHKINIPSLSFLEYLDFKNLPLPHSLPSLKNFSPSLKASFHSNSALYKLEFKNFLINGQYPEIITNPDINPKEYIADLTDHLINFDIPYFYKVIDRPLFLNFVKSLSFELANEFSINNMSKSLDSDRRTLGQYLKILEETNLFASCYNAKFKSLRKKLAANKKIYSLNSSLSLNINGFDKSYLSDGKVFGHYFENYAFTRLLDLFKNVEYYQDKNFELDFVTSDYVFEIKSGEIKDADKYLSVAKSLGKKLVFITDSELDSQRDYSLFPAYYL